MCKIYRLCLLLSSLLLVSLSACSAPGDTTINPESYQILVEPEAGIEPLLAAINNAQNEIDLVMYLFTDKRVANALIQAAQRGVTVRALIEKAPYEAVDANDWLKDFWQGTPIQYHWVPSTGSPLNYYHEKTMLIDHRQAWIMTLNYVYSSFSQRWPERNFAVVDNDAQDVASLDQLFQQDWQAQTPTNITSNNLVVSPINTKQQLDGVIAEAHGRLKIYAEGLDDYHFIGEVAKVARHGVNVQIIYGGKLQRKAQNYLIQSGVSLHPAAQIKNHAKAIVVDNDQIYIGSANFTENAFNYNREVGVIIHNPELNMKLAAQFDQDWAS